jgi:hypothetical protein
VENTKYPTFIEFLTSQNENVMRKLSMFIFKMSRLRTNVKIIFGKLNVMLLN